MQENKVKIADGSPETRARLNNFKGKMQLRKPLEKITMGDAIDYAIEQAEKVSELEMRMNSIDPETLGRLNEFVNEHNITNQKNPLDNISDAIDFLIQTVEFFESVCIEGNLLDFTVDEIESMDIDPKYMEFLRKFSRSELK